MHILQNWKENTLHLEPVTIYDSPVGVENKAMSVEKPIWHQVQPLDSGFTIVLSLELPLNWELFGNETTQHNWCLESEADVWFC